MTNCKAKHIYPKQLEELLEGTNYIPRKLKLGENLKQYHRYWSSFFDVFFKVMQIYHVEKTEYYSVKFPNLLFGEISFPVDYNYMYELMVDYHNIKDIENIINHSESFTGAEIRYWFYINKINLNDPKYRAFYPFLNPESKSGILDDKHYFICATQINNAYTNCKVKIDKSK